MYKRELEGISQINETFVGRISIKVESSTAATGTVTLEGRTTGAEQFETMYDNAGVPVSFDMSAPETVYFGPLRIDEFQFTPSFADRYTVLIEKVDE